MSNFADNNAYSDCANKSFGPKHFFLNRYESTAVLTCFSAVSLPCVNRSRHFEFCVRIKKWPLAITWLRAHWSKIKG